LRISGIATPYSRCLHDLGEPHTELLKRRRDKLEKAAAPPTVPAEQPAVLDGPLTPRPVDEAVIDANQARLLELRRALGDYVAGLAEPDPSAWGLRRRMSADA
jgi:hypothetical protein